MSQSTQETRFRPVGYEQVTPHQVRHNLSLLADKPVVRSLVEELVRVKPESIDAWSDAEIAVFFTNFWNNVDELQGVLKQMTADQMCKVAFMLAVDLGKIKLNGSAFSAYDEKFLEIRMEQLDELLHLWALWAVISLPPESAVNLQGVEDSFDPEKHRLIDLDNPFISQSDLHGAVDPVT